MQISEIKKKKPVNVETSLSLRCKYTNHVTSWALDT